MSHKKITTTLLLLSLISSVCFGSPIDDDSDFFDYSCPNLESKNPWHLQVYEVA